MAPPLRSRQLPLLCAAWLLVSACGDDTVVGGGDTGNESSSSENESGPSSESETGASETDTTDTGAMDLPPEADMGGGDEPDPAEPLFEPGVIAEFNIILDELALAVLDADGKIYVKGDLDAIIDGQVYALPNIGVRLKGNYGSFRTLDEKAAFLLDFNRYMPGQDLLGIDKLAVNNMVQDRSMQREVIGYRLFRESEVPAPRASHAVVSVNGEPYGLYTLVESIDNDGFLNDWFGDNSGNLYEGAYGSDLEFARMSSYDLDNGEDVDLADIIELIALLDSIESPDQFVDIAGTAIDLESYVKMAAVDIFIGDWDGYPYSRNNYFIYRRPSDMRWVFMPWGIDQTLANHLAVFGGIGRVSQMCNESLACRAMLAAEIEAVVARSDQLDLPGFAAQLGDQLHDAALADPRKEYDIAAVEATIAANIEFLSNRGPELLAQLACTDPNLIDEDNDGFNGCGEDCNDNDPDTFPGADELCDLADNDCDGVWDNDPMCPQCVIEPLPPPSQSNAAFCFAPRNWAAAEADCVTQGGHLVSIHDQATQTFLISNAFGIAGGDWWIGLNDQLIEGMFAWSDGTPFDFSSWAGGEPNNAGNEDCVHLPPWAGGNWNDLPCANLARYICELP